MQKKIVIANWKMNPVSEVEALKLFKSIVKNQKDIKGMDVVVCAPSVFLSNLSKLKLSKVALGAQNVFYEDSGAYTGEVSPKMLSSRKIKYCIVGHSERRSMGETDADCNKKLIALLKNKITPILCVGEKDRLPDHGYLNFVKHQLEQALSGIPKSAFTKIVIAYEPVWAIGSNAVREVTPAECQEMILYIRKLIAGMSDPKVAHGVRVIYGGSVNEKNIKSLATTGNADGFLVGRDSLVAKKFLNIIQSV